MRLKKSPIEILIQHLSELGIEFVRENNHQSVVSFKSATAIASTICLSNDERVRDVNNTVQYFIEKYTIRKQ